MNSSPGRSAGRLGGTDEARRKDVMRTLRVETLDRWRDWLDQHHASESEVWLVFYKRQTGVASIAYEDALDEALCFGWVDSLVKRLDDRRYALKITPRRPDSRWSTKNRQRYEALKSGGRLKPAGIKRRPTDRGYGPRPPRLSMPAKLPAYIQAALRKQPAAWRHFQALPLAQRRRYYAWIESAKREETKLRRLKEAIRLLVGGKVLGLK
jgi:uncharacterized protein YdeI (YjbR/CyaY-like superfamily)